jgi:hypothetical protein
LGLVSQLLGRDTVVRTERDLDRLPKPPRNAVGVLCGDHHDALLLGVGQLAHRWKYLRIVRWTRIKLLQAVPRGDRQGVSH